MSGTTTTPPTLAERATDWARPVTAYLSVGAFILALGLAYWHQDAASINILVGAVIANSNTVVNYFFGSSRSSQAKDATIAQLAAAPTPEASKP